MVAGLTQVGVCNLALNLIGSNVPISSGDGLIENTADATPEALTCKEWYPRAVSGLLEGYPWSFATGYETLTLHLEGGDADIWSSIWRYAYLYPADCLRMRGFLKDPLHITGTYSDDANSWSRSSPERPWRYEVKNLDGTKVLITNVDPDRADVEYTRLTLDPEDFTEKFTETLCYKLASSLAVSLAVSDGKANRAMAMYSMTLREAMADNANEQQPRDRGDESYITARHGN